MKKQIQATLFALLVMTAIPALSQSPSLPPSITKQIPPDNLVMTFKSSDFNGDGRSDYVVVVHAKDEQALFKRGDSVAQRPLLVFMQGQDGKFSLEGRNDHVVLAADEGGQCDPFLDSEEGLAVKGAFFTVQNAVACGSHWSDYVTFRYSKELGHFVFHKRIVESYDPLIGPSANKKFVSIAKKSAPVLLGDYVPKP